VVSLQDSARKEQPVDLDSIILGNPRSRLGNSEAMLLSHSQERSLRHDVKFQRSPI
jgi:hypothetical protein